MAQANTSAPGAANTAPRKALSTSSAQATQREREFAQRLEEETQIACRWLKSQAFQQGQQTITVGYELEAWLTGHHGEPLPINRSFLELADDPLIVPELSRYNIELNAPPQNLDGDCLSQMHSGLSHHLAQAQAVAKQLAAKLTVIGTLPSLEQRQLGAETLSPCHRYHQLNQRILAIRHQRPISLHIQGQNSLDTIQYNVMLEAAGTSLQLHIKPPPQRAVALINAASIISAFSVAISANAPLLFGNELWAETRIPLFEQAVGSMAKADCTLGNNRVSFGQRYHHRDLSAYFLENQQCYPILLPDLSDALTASLDHLRLHNGTIWQWNRPLIGFDNDGQRHLRLEHRVMSAGPSVADMIANAAFAYGCLLAIADRLDENADSAEALLPFQHAKANFYQAAQHGLNAHIQWQHQPRQPIDQIILEQLLPSAHQALIRQGLTAQTVDHFLNIIEQRVSHHAGGANWQRHQHRQGLAPQEIVKRYQHWQDSGLPVHLWEL